MNIAPTLDRLALNPTRTPAAAKVNSQSSTDASESSDTHSRADGFQTLVAGLMEFFAHLVTARISGIISHAKQLLNGVAHPNRGGASVRERLTDTGHGIVSWTKQHPGQAIAAGTAVITAAVLIGIMLHRANADTPKREIEKSSRKRRAKNKKSQAK